MSSVSAADAAKIQKFFSVSERLRRWRGANARSSKSFHTFVPPARQQKYIIFNLQIAWPLTRPDVEYILIFQAFGTLTLRFRALPLPRTGRPTLVELTVRDK